MHTILNFWSGNMEGKKLILPFPKFPSCPFNPAIGGIFEGDGAKEVVSIIDLEYLIKTNLDD
jgi:hypothetical protein